MYSPGTLVQATLTYADERGAHGMVGSAPLVCPKGASLLQQGVREVLVRIAEPGKDSLVGYVISQSVPGKFTTSIAPEDYILLARWSMKMPIPDTLAKIEGVGYAPGRTDWAYFFRWHETRWKETQQWRVTASGSDRVSYGLEEALTRLPNPRLSTRMILVNRTLEGKAVKAAWSAGFVPIHLSRLPS